MAWLLENSHFRAQVSPTGGELSALWDKRKGKHLLWQPDKGIWNNSATQLFPVVGRLIHEGLWQGQRFLPLPAHGFLRHQVFRCLDAQDDQLLLEACETEATLACWPWRWRVQLAVKLLDDGIRISQTVCNPDETAFHYSLGWHPGFALPVATQSGWQVRFDGESVTGPLFTRNRTLEIPENPPLSCEFPLTEHCFQDGAVYFGNCRQRRLDVCTPEGAPVLSVETGAQDWLALWGVPGADLLCIEPLAGTTDAPNFAGQMAHKRGMHRLMPGEQKTFETRIRFAVDAR